MVHLYQLNQFELGSLHKYIMVKINKFKTVKS